MVAELFKARNRRLSLLICISIIVGMASPLFAPETSAATSRIAKVISVTGEVEVTKAGGKKPYKAFKNLYLNQGDHIKTGSKASVVLEVEDRKDEVTVGPNSSLYVSKLQEDDGKETSFKVWSGSMWVKASSLLDTEDSFEIETPTAVMGVRGTQFGIHADMYRTEVFVGAGIVQVGIYQSPNAAQSPASNPSPVQDTALVYPTQQIEVLTDPETYDVDSIVSIVDPQEFVGTADPQVIEAIIRNKPSADAENREIFERISEGTIGVPDELLEDGNPEDLERFDRNLNAFINVIARTAIEQNIIDQQTIERIREEVSQQSQQTLNLDLDGNAQLELTEKQREAQSAKKEKKAELEQKKEQVKKQKEEALGADNVSLLNDLYNKMNELNRQNADAQQSKLESEYVSRLSEEERRRYEQNKQQNAEPAKPTPSPSANVPSSGGGSSGTTTHTGAVLQTAGTVTGNVQIAANAGASTMYGPHEGTVTVKGNVTISGADPRTFILKNINIEGTVTVDMPNGSVALWDTVKVNGRTIVNDVKTGTFMSQAEHLGALTVADGNGTKLYLGGKASHASVEITGGGSVILEGTYLEEIQIKAANAQLIVPLGTVVEGLDIQAGGVKLSNGGLILSIRTSNGSALDSTVTEAQSSIAAALAAINDAETHAALKETITAMGVSITNYQAEILFAHKEAEPFASLSEVRSLLLRTPAEEPILRIEYLGSSPAAVGSELSVLVTQPVTIYFVPYYGSYHSRTDLEATVAAGNGVKAEVPAAFTATDFKADVPAGEYQLVSVSSSGELHYHSAKIKMTNTLPDGVLTGKVQLPREAGANGASVLVYAESQAGELSPVGLPQPFAVEHYAYVYVPSGQTEGEFTIPVDASGRYRVGYYLLSGYNVKWIQSAYVGEDGGMETDPSDANAVEPGSAPLNLTVAEGRLLQGWVRMSEDMPEPGKTVYVVAHGEEGYGWADVYATPGGESEFWMAVPAGTYKLQYIAVDHSGGSGTSYYYSNIDGVEGYTDSWENATMIEVTEEDRTGLSLIVPASGVVIDEVGDIHPNGFALTWKSELEHFRLTMEKLNPDMSVSEIIPVDPYQFDEPSNGSFRSLTRAFAVDVPLELQQSYRVTVTGYDNHDYVGAPVAMDSIVFTPSAFPESNKPILQSSYPADGEVVNASALYEIELVFDDFISSVDESLLTLSVGESELPYDIVSEGGWIAIRPIDALLPGTIYTVSIEAGAVRNDEGIKNDPIEFSFATMGEISVTAAVYDGFALAKWGAYPDAAKIETTIDGSWMGNKSQSAEEVAFYKNFSDLYTVDEYEFKATAKDGSDRVIAEGAVTVREPQQTFIQGMDIWRGTDGDINVEWSSIGDGATYHLIVLDGYGDSIQGRSTTSALSADLGIQYDPLIGTMVQVLVVAEVDGKFVAIGLVSKLL